mgnify:CR=1 FL=1
MHVNINLMLNSHSERISTRYCDLTWAYLAAAGDDGLEAQTRAAAHVHGADALGPVELVRRQRQRVAAQRGHIDGNLADSLEEKNKRIEKPKKQKSLV